MINYTENLKNTLDETINQLELISIVVSEEVDTGIIAWFNNNEGFVAFLGVIASFVVSVTAIVISILTYRSQKKEQTKNAQESAKLQKELTKQQNKFQADLQLRQIKIDSFKEKFECYYALSTLIFLRFRVMNSILDYQGGKFNPLSLAVTVADSCNNLTTIENILVNLKKMKLFFDEKEGSKLDEFFTIFYNISVCYLKLGQIVACRNLQLYDFSSLIQELFDNFNKMQEVFPYINKLEKEINLYFIDKIDSSN